MNTTLTSKLAFLGNQQETLFSEAFKVRQKYFGTEVYPRGVIEISNHCLLNCHYCGMRKNNSNLKRYRMQVDEIMSQAHLMADHGVKSIMLQSGDDYQFQISELKNIVKTIKTETNLHIILCLGERKKTDFETLLLSGANMYILKLETMNPKLFAEVRPETTFERRLDKLKFLKNIGFEVSSGFIIGLPGQTLDELIDGIYLLKELGVENASVSPFIPNQDSPLNNYEPGNINIALNMIALMRIILGKVNIPSVSAFSMLNDEGQLRAFEAGANVLTINFSPLKNLEKYLIYDKKRAIVNLEYAKMLIKNSKLDCSILQSKITERLAQTTIA